MPDEHHLSSLKAWAVPVTPRGSFLPHFLTTSGTFVDITAVVGGPHALNDFAGCLVEGNVVFGG